MLQHIDVIGKQTVMPILTLPLSGMSMSDPLQLKSVDGLGPVKASIASTPFGTFRGEAYMGSSTGKRNIVLTLGLNPDWNTQTTETLRLLVYKYFMPEQPTQLSFTSTHLPQVTISGYVEGVEPNIFSKDPEVQVSIICLEPDFVAIDQTVAYGASEYSPVIETINYIGNAPAGFVLELSTSAGPGIEALVQVILDGVDQQKFQIISEFSSSFKFQLSTIPGSKYAQDWYLPSGPLINRLYSVTPSSQWPLLLPGDNNLTIVTLPSPIDWSLIYNARFGGL